MKLLLEQITITDTTGWSGPFSAGDIARIDATKFDKGVYTKDGKTTYWYKEKGSGGGGRVVQQDNRECPPNVEKFQKWLNDKNIPWYYPMPGPVNGKCGTKTKDAWAKHKTDFEKDVPTGGSTPPKPDDKPSKVTTIYDIDKNVASASTFFKFYTRNMNDEQILWLNPVQNMDFETDSRILSIVKRASRIKEREGVNATFAYLKAVIFETGDLVGSFDIKLDKNNELTAYKNTRLNENKLFFRVVGLANLLFESNGGYIKYFIKFAPDGGKYIGDEKNYNDRGRIDVTFVISQYFNNNKTPYYFPPLKFASENGRPDKAPIVGEVKIKLDVNDGKGNVFTDGLKTAIEKYRTENKISHDTKPGDIDFQLIKSLFKEKFDETERKINGN